MISELPTKSAEAIRAELECRAVLAKPVDQRTYDDLIAIKRCVTSIESLQDVLVDLQPWQQDELFRSMNLEVYEAGDVIFNQGDRGDKFFIVLDGEVEIQQLRSEAEITVTQKMTVRPNDAGLFLVPIAVASTGGYFGERALEYNEPRSAAAKALTTSDLIVISGDTYKSILSAAVKQVDLSKQLTFKTVCRRVLTQKQSARTEVDLETLSEYFTRRIGFFRNTPHDTLMDICRVLQLVTINGKTTIFRQNSMGQGFYVILTGTVEIRVATQDKSGNYIEIPVNSIREGFSFGDRAMENENGMRMATATASDDFTELLVLSRHDYSRLLAPFYAKELQVRSELLNRTLGFQELSTTCREELARFMEPRHYRVDQPICSAGTQATEMLVICRGEAFGSRTLAVETGRNTQKGVTLPLGKIGPGTLIGGYLALAENMSDEVLAQEDVVATTMCKLYVLAKFDLLHRVSAATLQQLREEIAGLKHAQTLVYTNIRPSSGQREWARTAVWEELRNRFLEHHHFDFEGKRDMLSTLTRPVEGNESHETDDQQVGEDNTILSLMDTGRLSDARLRALMPGTDEPHTSHFESRSGSRFSAISARRPSRRSTMSRGSGGSNSRGRANEHFGNAPYTAPQSYNARELQRHPLCLVHLYREKLRLQSGRGSRKYGRCFFRLLGGFNSGEDAKAAVRNYFHHMTYTLGMHQASMDTGRSAQEKESHVLMSNELLWQPFKGWDMFALNHSDHFVIYGKDGPVEYFSDTIKELHPQQGTNDDYPMACRQRGQKFACVHIAKLTASTYNDTATAKKQRLFLRELSAFAELHAITRNKNDAIRYTQHLTRLSLISSYEGSAARIFTIPMFRWIQFSDDALVRWDGKLQSSADDASVGTEDADRTSELKRLLADSGLAPKDGNFLEFVETPKWLRGTSAGEDSSTKFLMDLLNEKSKAKFTSRPEEKRPAAKLDATHAASVDSIESTYEKAKNGMLAHRMLCEARSKIVNMSNELFRQEEHARSLRADDQFRASTGNLHQLMGRLNRKQWEVLKAISELPDRKNLVKGISKSSKQAAGQLTHRTRVGHASLQPLCNKLDALDEMLRAELRIQSS